MPAAANGDKDRIKRAGVLMQNFHGDRALSGDHVGVVKRMHESELFLFFQDARKFKGVTVRIAVQHGLATQAFYGFYLDGGRRSGHHDHGATTQPLGGHGDTLGMVAGRGGNDPALERFGRQIGHFVVGAADFEAEHRLGIFAFEQHCILNSL